MMKKPFHVDKGLKCVIISNVKHFYKRFAKTN